jgi:hypothetical protein
LAAERGVSRRTVLLGLGGAATAAFVAVAAGVTLADRDDSSDDAGGDRTTEESVVRVGEAYRAAYPDEDDQSLLERELPDLDGARGAELDARLRLLDERVRQDFADGDVVLVDGWLLSRTEARAAALVSIVA